MRIHDTLGRLMTRRTMLGLTGAAVASSLLVACADRDDDDEPAADVSDDAELDDDDEEEAIPDDDDDEEMVDDEPSDDMVDEEPEEPDEEEDDEEDDPEDPEAAASVIVDDVIDFTLAPEGRWDGPFGSVTMQLHHGWVDGEDVTFIRTDASDQDFAEEEGLVHVPLIGLALDAPGSYSNLYLFRNASDDQLPVMSMSPADGEAFSPAFQIFYVDVHESGDEPLMSEQAILDAASDGDVEIEETDIVVNYPVVTWPGGQIAVDEDKVEALGGGQLLEDPDIEGGSVMLKLHQCYPGSRYIITDTSALPMAPMMGAGEAGGSQLLIEAGAIAPITIFLNGLEGTGAMGFQPGVFNTDAGNPAWSPFWEHFAAEWVSAEDAVPVTSQQQLDDLVASGDLILYGGVPDTDPDTFVVNCSVPVLAPVTWEPAE
jgi:hypothetical protein